MRSLVGLMLGVWLAAVSTNALAQNLDVNGLQPAVPTEFPTAQAAGGGLAQYGYQFQHGTFVVMGGMPPTVNASFVLKTPQFPLPSADKLFEEELTWLGYIPSGPNEGAVFECEVNGNKRYFLFGVKNLGSMGGGVETRRIKYFNAAGEQTFSTTARFYAP